MIPELQSTLEATALLWPALWKHIPCMAHIIQLAFGVFMSSLSVKGCTKSWEAHERNQQFGENESIDNGKSQRLRKEVNARINKVSATKPGLANIFQKLRILWHFGSPEIDLHIVENACRIDYADTWSSKRVHWLSNCQSSQRGSADYGCEDMLKFNSAVARARLPTTGIHRRVAAKSNIHWLPASIHNSRWVDHCAVCDGSIEAIVILDPVDVEEA